MTDAITVCWRHPKYDDFAVSFTLPSGAKQELCLDQALAFSMALNEAVRLHLSADQAVDVDVAADLVAAA